MGASRPVALNLLQDAWIETIRAGSASRACSTPAKRRMPEASRRDSDKLIPSGALDWLGRSSAPGG